MAAIGGSIESVTLGGRNFPVASDVDAQRKLGGWENEVMQNGNGSARLVKTRVPFTLTGLSVEIDDDRGDQEFLQKLADGTAFFPVAVTFASGAVYQGSAQLTGEIQFANQNSSATLSLAGPGKLTVQ